jgi:preprotein translocase subunit SecY
LAGAVRQLANPQGAPYLIIYTSQLIIRLCVLQYTGESESCRDGQADQGRTAVPFPVSRTEKLEEYLTKVLNRIVLPGSPVLGYHRLDSHSRPEVLQFPASVAMLFGGTRC